MLNGLTESFKPADFTDNDNLFSLLSELQDTMEHRVNLLTLLQFGKAEVHESREAWGADKAAKVAINNAREALLRAVTGKGLDGI
jgi:hypothetical protein